MRISIATANNIESLPPELLRKGRFDEVFFIDLPSPQERATILAIHLTKHHRDYRDFNLARHTTAAKGFSSAELEQVVISALYDAFAEGENAHLEDRHLEKAVAESVPLSQSMAAKIERLRNEARQQWRWASGLPDAHATDAVRDVAMAEPPPAPKKQKGSLRCRR